MENTFWSLRLWTMTCVHSSLPSLQQDRWNWPWKCTVGKNGTADSFTSGKNSCKPSYNVLSGYKSEDLEFFINLLCKTIYMVHFTKSKYQAIKKKYSSDKVLFFLFSLTQNTHHSSALRQNTANLMSSRKKSTAAPSLPRNRWKSVDSFHQFSVLYIVFIPSPFSLYSFPTNKLVLNESLIIN